MIAVAKIEKSCSNKNCKQQNPQSIGCFANNISMKDGYQNWCRSCLSIHRLEYQSRPEVKKQKAIAQKRVRNRKKLIDPIGYSKQRRKWVLKAQYGLTPEDYNRMFLEQNGCCYICGNHASENKKGLAVDHSHQTNKVRKLLCSQCNILLGAAKENTKILETAIAYIKEYS